MNQSIPAALLAAFTGALLISGDATAQTAPLCGARRVPLITDFEDGEASSPEAFAALYLFNDGTGVQTPADSLDFVIEGGPGRSRFMAYTAGDGFVEWGGGLGVALGCGYDVRRYQGLTFAVRAGGAGSFRFEVTTNATVPVENAGACTEGCNDHYGFDISLPREDWYECSVRFQDLAQAGWGGVPLPLDLQAVSGAQYVFSLDDMPFDMAVDEISFAPRVRATGCVPMKTDTCGGKKHVHAHKRGPKRR